MLSGKPQPGANIVFRGARVIDPVEGIDASLDVRIDDGVIAALGMWRLMDMRKLLQPPRIEVH